MDKNIVNVSVYQINEKISLYAYTALWCGPCKKIKPILIKIMERGNYQLIKSSEIQKTEFKKINEFVPFFMLKNDLGEKVDSIQTSDEILFTDFLRKNGIGIIIIDEDF